MAAAVAMPASFRLDQHANRLALATPSSGEAAPPAVAQKTWQHCGRAATTAKKTTAKKSSPRLDDAGGRSVEDIRTLARLLELVGVQAAPRQAAMGAGELGPTSFDSITHTISHHFSTKTEDAVRAVQTVLKCLQLLHAYGCTSSDVEVIVAHATSYANVLKQTLEKDMQLKEFVYVFCVLMYLAHSYTEDNTISLRHWHKHIFVGYCPISVLNSAILGLMKQLSYKLRVEPKELTALIEFLHQTEPVSPMATAN